MKRLVEIVSWMALFFVLVFAYVEYTKENQGPVPDIARFNPEIHAYENGQFLNAKRRPIKVTWRFLQKTQDGVVAEALLAIDVDQARDLVQLLNKRARASGSESPRTILGANSQVWALKRDNPKFPPGVAAMNEAIAAATVRLMKAETGNAKGELEKYTPSSMLGAEYVQHLLSFLAE